MSFQAEHFEEFLRKKYPERYCDKCGAELHIGSWPWCPHEDARGFGDAPLEPYWDENISPEGAYITSRGQRRAIMSKNHLDYHDVSRKKRGKFYLCLGG